VKTRQKITRGLLGLAASIALLSPSARASAVITLANSNGATDSIFGLAATATGSGMSGLFTVTVFFTNGSNSGPVSWTTNVGACTTAALCGLASGAIGNGSWTLTESLNSGFVADPNNPDTTAQNPWTLTTSSSTVGIASVVLNGVVSNTRGVVFDRDFFGAPPGASSGGQEGTAGGVGGLDFTFKTESASNSGNTTTVQYSNIAALIAAPPCRGSNWSANNPVTGCQDEWGTVSFAFSNSFIATTTTAPVFYSFFQDTDLVDAPEPNVFVLSGLGLLALGIYRKVRKAKLSS